MPGIRVDRFLASAALVLLLSAGGAFADPKNSDATDPAAQAATPAPDTTNTSAPAPADTDKAAVKPAQPAEQAQSPIPASATTIQAGASIPAPAAAATTPAAEAPAVVPQPTGTASAPAASPATTATPAAETPAAGTPAAATAAVVTGPDAPIADQLRSLVNGKFDNVSGNKNDRTQIDAFYSARNYAPLWITDGKANERATAAIAYLGDVDADGLFPSDYPAPNFTALSDPADLAAAELKLTMSVITYAHHASIGRVHWSRVTADASYDQSAPGPGDVLAKMATATDVRAALDSYEPQTPGYLALKAKLADIRAGKTDNSKPPIATGPVLKLGMQDDRVPQLRERLGILGDGGTTFDKPLAEAVKKYQQDHNIAATGTLTVATIEALNGVKPDHAADIIIANMERWRWMPHQFPDTYVIVNLPDYTLRVMHDGKLVWMTRIVIGKPELPTPIMTADMKYITINPTWNVPPSIINHEYLPALEQDPTVLDRMGLKLDHNPDGSIRIWQPPGDKNALGRIRFNFPNKFLVYQHDTPDKYMFAYDKRAFSHGCMRVQDPQHYAEVLLSLVRPSDGYSDDRIQKMIASNDQTDIPFPTFIAVNLTYQTAFVDDDGKLEFRDDVYGRDKALLAILKGDERKVADIPIEHKQDISHLEVTAMPDQPSLFGGRGFFGGGANYYPNRGGYSGGDNFFSRLFGGFADAPPPAAHRPAHSKKVTRSGDTAER
jgi:murein L,D-transpeptidase YcbB/YkuD